MLRDPSAPSALDAEPKARSLTKAAGKEAINSAPKEDAYKFSEEPMHQKGFGVLEMSRFMPSLLRVDKGRAMG